MNNAYETKKDFFSGSFVGQDESYHHITTDSSRLIDLGLQSFTTGSLYDWLHLKDNGSIVRKNYEGIDSIDGLDTGFLKEYPNQRFWRNKYQETGGIRWPHESIYTHSNSTVKEFCSQKSPTPSQEPLVYFEAWRSDGRNGNYVKVKIVGNYEDQDLDWSFSKNNVEYSWSDIDPEWYDYVNITGWSSATSEVTTKPLLTPFLQTGKSIVHRIIEINNYARIIKQHKAPDTWSKSDLAAFYFTNDIKASKDGCFHWHSNIEFLLDIPSNILKNDGVINGCDGCSKLDDAYFKLYLFDKEMPKQTKRKIVNESITIARTPTTAYGFPYKTKDEKGRTLPSVNSTPLNLTAADLDFHYNDTTGKWEGGTTQVFAIMTENLEAAKQPKLEELLSEDDVFLLGTQTGMGVSIGKAVVLSMQNGNPLQWMPDFKSPKDCNRDNEKVILDVYNITNRSFAKGENVILQNIHGVWVPQSVGEAENYVTPADPKWDFTYLMTNSMFFFRNHDWYANLSSADAFIASPSSTTKTTPSDYEKSFYWWYYQDAENKTVDGSVEPLPINDNLKRYSDSVKRHARVLNGYMQVTSWDFMGIGIGGTRRKGNNGSFSKENTYITENGALTELYEGENGVNGNALSATQFDQDQTSQPYLGDGEKLTYPFFGCVFPEGYDASEKYAQLMAGPSKGFYLAPKNYEEFLEYKTKTPFFYAAQSPFENLNNVRNIVPFSHIHQELGMFPEGEAGSLKHLPSDIGTNASPSGVYGRPISNIGIIGEINKQIGVTTGADFREIVASYFDKDDLGLPKHLSWMHMKEDSDGARDNPIQQGAQYGYQDSAFDLKPISPLKIEFRPLSQEVYSSFEGTGWNGENVEPKYDDTLAASANVRGNFAREGYQFNKAYGKSQPKDGYTPSLSPSTLFRNPQILSIGTDDISDPRVSLFSQGSENYNGLHYNYGLSNKEASNLSPDDMNYASKYWFEEAWMDTTVPAGGIGVIGAVVTIATSTEIQFQVDSVVGLDDYVEIGGAYPPSWRGGDYSTLNTTQLYARVYQQWPREQTIYDPRFFVVHHFNAGNEIRNNAVKSEANDEANRNYGTNAPNNLVDVLESDVDFVVPTFWDNAQVPVNLAVYYDSTSASLSDGVVGVSQLRKKAHWRVSTQRRGKLLPYSYKFATIGLNSDPVIRDVSANFGYINGTYVGVTETFTVNSEQDILIVNKGEGYTKNSKFVTEGGDGGGVLLKAKVDEQGRVTGFDVESNGYDFSANNFVSSSYDVEYARESSTTFPSFDFKVKIVAQSNSESGTGFVGYMCRGRTTESPTITDAKPMEALTSTGPIKLTPNPPIQREGNEVQTLQTSEQENIPLKIRPIASTPNNQYDVFFHFHNDISHTRVHSNYRPQELEQRVKIEILTDGSAGSSLVDNAQGENQNNSSAQSDTTGNSFASSFGSARNPGGGGGLLGSNGWFGGAMGNLS